MAQQVKWRLESVESQLRVSWRQVMATQMEVLLLSMWVHRNNNAPVKDARKRKKISHLKNRQNSLISKKINLRQEDVSARLRRG